MIAPNIIWKLVAYYVRKIQTPSPYAMALNFAKEIGIIFQWC